MSSESDIKVENENNSFKQQAIRTEADVVHYHLRGAEREKALPPREESPKEENQPSKKEKSLKEMIDSLNSLHSASSPDSDSFNQRGFRAAHYRIKGAPREKALPPKEDSPKEENQPSKEEKKNAPKKE